MHRDLGTGSRQRDRRGIRASETDNLMTSRRQFSDDGGTDVTGRAGNEYTTITPGRPDLAMDSRRFYVDVDWS